MKPSTDIQRNGVCVDKNKKTNHRTELAETKHGNDKRKQMNGDKEENMP